MRKLVLLILIAAISLSVSSCDIVSMVIATNTPTATNTPLPTDTPVPTDTPLPTATFTPAPTDTPPPTFTSAPPTPALPTATLTKDQAVLVYYINKEDNGPYGCGEALWYVKTQFAKTGNVVVDVTNALRTILSYHSESIGTLHNPGWASNLSVSGVEFNGGSVKVALSGQYNKTDDPCDASRFKDQLRLTIKQFAGVQNIAITINGTPIADVLSRK